MATIKLTRQTALYAKKVQHTETGNEYEFEWRGDAEGQMMGRRFYHIIENALGKTRLLNHEMEQYEVTECLYTPHLTDLWNLAYRAYSGTSFSPERRQEDAIHSHEMQLLEDLKEFPQGEHERYIAKYKELFSAVLSADSRCMSSMITGPANFPTRRNQRNQDYAMNASTRFVEWRKKAIEAIKKKVESNRLASLSEEERLSEEFSSLKREIAEYYTATYCGAKSLLYGKLERIALKGNVEMIALAMEWLGELAKKTKPIFTQRHKIYKLQELAERANEQLNAKKEMLTEVEENDVCEIHRNHEADRLQLIFDGKPSPEVISILKKNGYRWSPRFGAWQRQLTLNATSGLERVINAIKEVSVKEQ